MLPWLPSVPRRLRLRIKIVSISALLHLGALLLLLVAYRGDYAHYQIDLSKQRASDVPVVFLPLRKRVQSQGVVGTKGRSKNKRSVKQKAIRTVPAKIAQKPATSVAPAVDRQMLAKKSSQKKAKKRDVVERTKEEVVLPKGPEVKSLQDVHTVEAISQVSAAPVNEQVVPSTPQDAIYIGQVERDALLIQEEILKEIEHHWRPPVGLGSDKVCQIKILIDWDGTIKELVVKESSGILAFDIAARCAVVAMKLPKASWGKDLIMHFKA
jgi:hypothetical protein